MTAPGLMFPDQRTIAAMRRPPSQQVTPPCRSGSLEPMSRPLRPSRNSPLSDMKKTKMLSATPEVSSDLSTRPIALSSAVTTAA